MLPTSATIIDISLELDPKSLRVNTIEFCPLHTAQPSANI